MDSEPLRALGTSYYATELVGESHPVLQEAWQRNPFDAEVARLLAIIIEGLTGEGNVGIFTHTEAGATSTSKNRILGAHTGVLSHEIDSSAPLEVSNNLVVASAANSEGFSVIAKDDDIAERFVLSIKSECLSKIIPLGEHHLRWAIQNLVDHYHLERPHQGIGNVIMLTLPPAE